MSHSAVLTRMLVVMAASAALGLGGCGFKEAPDWNAVYDVAPDAGGGGVVEDTASDAIVDDTARYDSGSDDIVDDSGSDDIVEDTGSDDIVDDTGADSVVRDADDASDVDAEPIDVCGGPSSVSEPATEITTSSEPLCSGESTTLTVTGGSLGTDASWNWYTGGCGGTSVDAGSSITVSPGSSTTYYVRAEGACNLTNCVSTTVDVKSNSVAASSANSEDICPGESTSLSVEGGMTGTGAEWNWYSESCGGTPEGEGGSISVSPDATTEYFARAEGDCNTTDCVSTTVDLKTESTAASSANASKESICPGESSTLSVEGGTLGTGAEWNWYAGSCGGTPQGEGDSISVSPDATTDYFARAEGNCNTTDCAGTTVSLKTESTAPTGASASPSTVCGGSATLTKNGGSLGTGSEWVWYAGSCGGTRVGTGESITVSPGSDTSYYVRAEGDCGTTSCATTTVSALRAKEVDYVEDGDVSEYFTGPENPVYSASTDRAIEGAYSVKIRNDNDKNGEQIFSTSGLPNYPAQGDVFEVRIFHEGQRGGNGVRWGVQDADNFYEVQLAEPNTAIKFKVNSGGSKTTLDSQDVNWPVGEWLKVRVEWGSTGDTTVKVYDASGNKIAELQGNDTTFSNGGIGLMGYYYNGVGNRYFDQFELICE